MPKITTGQQVAFSMLLNLCANIWVMPGASISSAGRSFWIPIAIGALNTVLATYLVLGLSKKFPGLTGIEVAKRVLGRYLGWAFGFLWAAFLALGSAADGRVAVEQVWERYFVYTPIWAVISFSFLGVILLALSGPFRMARMAPLMAGYVFVGFFILIAFSTQYARPAYLLPLIDLSALEPLSRDFWVAAMPFRIVYIVPLFMPFFDQPQRIIRTFNWGLVLGLVGLLAAGATAVSFFGPEGSRAIGNPYAKALSIVTVYNFPFERLELFPRYFHLMASLFTVAVLFYSSGLAFAQLFGIKNPTWPVFGVAVFGTILASISPENFLVEELVKWMLVLAPLFLLGFVLMWIIYYARGMHRQPPETSEPQDEAVKTVFQ